MEDWIILLMLAISGIMGYRLIGLVEKLFNRHTADSDKTDRE
jgi:hypothetical protein